MQSQVAIFTELMEEVKIDELEAEKHLNEQRNKKILMSRQYWSICASHILGSRSDEAQLLYSQLESVWRSKEVAKRKLEIARVKLQEASCKYDVIYAKIADGVAERKLEVCDEVRTGNFQEMAEQKLEVCEEARTGNLEETAERKLEVCDEVRTGNFGKVAKKKTEVCDEARTGNFEKIPERKSKVTFGAIQGEVTANQMKDTEVSKRR